MTAEIKSVGHYHEADAQVATRPMIEGSAALKYPMVGKLETLTNELTESVYFRIKTGTMELTAHVTDPVKLEQIGLSILAIARLHRK